MNNVHPISWHFQYVDIAIFLANLFCANLQEFKGQAGAGTLLVSAKVIALGILVSHFLRATIRKTGILKKNLSTQFFYGLLLTLIFSIFFVLLMNISSGLITDLRRFGFSNLTFTTLVFQAFIFAGAFLIWSLVYQKLRGIFWIS